MNTILSQFYPHPTHITHFLTLFSHIFLGIVTGFSMKILATFLVSLFQAHRNFLNFTPLS